MFIFTIKRHFNIYSIPSSINYFYNFGFVTFILIIIQILSGLLLTLYYSVDTNYYSIIYICRELYYGYALKYLHNNLPSLIFLFLLLHISRSLYYNIAYLNKLTWLNGIILYCLVSVICYLGYVLSWGQISYWGATVILNLLPQSIVTLISGSYYITIICLRRFFIFHFIIPFILLIIFILHVYYLHSLGSSTTVYNTTLLINMHWFIIIKDLFIFILFLSLITLTWDSLQLSHSDNLIYPDILKTPLHIVPEWYFLWLYTLLKIIPSKFIGFMLMIVFFLILILFIDIPYLSPWSIYLIILCYFLLMWIGAQYPLFIFIYYGRLIYLFLILLILSSLLYCSSK